MKYFLMILLFFLYTPLYAAEKILVCLPPIDPSYRSMNFQIKPNKETCAKDEKIFEVKKSEGQSLLLIPYETPNTQPAEGIPGNPSTGHPISYY